MIFFEKVAILGAGLLGASLAKALKKRAVAGSVSVWSRSESTRAKCTELSDVFDKVCPTPREAVENADIAVLCAPTENIPPLAREVATALKNGAILTDVGSVKGAICAECSAALAGTGAVFVGSHPMAGSEKIGIDFSDAELFESRPCFVVSNSDAGAQTLEAAGKLEALWGAVGMSVARVSASEHDAIVARISHLPHLLAGTLCLVAAAAPRDLRRFAGPGFRDTTRVASGSPAVWDSIVADNRGEILSALKDYRESLSALIAAVEAGDKAVISKRLRDAKVYRDGLV